MGNFRVKIIAILVQVLTLALFCVPGSSQSSSEERNIFAQAESYYLYEEYELANQLYLLLETPDNLNIKYKIGNCYLNIAGEKEKAIPYLEEAVKNASYDSKPQSFKEKRAPLDAYFSLARAYMVNNELDKGLKTLQTFKKLVPETGGSMKNTDYIDQQIMACKTAIMLKENPVSFSKKLMSADFNEGAINDNPAVSFDGNTIAYTERRGIVNVIFSARKENGIWQRPVDITSQLNAGEDCSTCSLNSDGTLLFLYKTDNYDGAIYSSNFVNGSWTPIKKLNRNINTKFYESHASISSDGKRLYFASNREGGEGNLDIYVSETDETGDWGPAKNLGPGINTPFNEDTPFITRNDSLLYFSSEGHNSMGGYDIFSSRKNGTSWETPVNIGYPINSSDDDKFFQPLNNGLNAYYTMTTGYKKRDIFYLGLAGPDASKLVEITGKVSLSDTSLAFDHGYRIYLVERQSGDTIDVGYPNKLTGIYSFFVVPGALKLVYTGPGYYSHTVDTAIYGVDRNKVVNIDVKLVSDGSLKGSYAKINLSDIPSVTDIDSNLLIKNLNVNDLNDNNINDSDILYYTVQVMALYKPIDMTFFKYIPEIKVMYNDKDKFYRYTAGIFKTREEAFALRLDLIRKGYPEEIFIKKVSR
jgi:tetratricopeptide (TPR) repeat protein